MPETRVLPPEAIEAVPMVAVTSLSFLSALTIAWGDAEAVKDLLGELRTSRFTKAWGRVNGRMIAVALHCGRRATRGRRA